MQETRGGAGFCNLWHLLQETCEGSGSWAGGDSDLCFHLEAHGMIQHKQVLVGGAKFWGPGVPACIGV